MLVPLMDGGLASASYCISRAALTTKHLPTHVAPVECLSAVGCLLLKDCVDKAQVLSQEEPLTAALTATAAHHNRPLQQLVCAEHLGESHLQSMRYLLANQVAVDSSPQPRLFSVIRQCTIFEDFAGNMVSYSATAWLKMLPDKEWEAVMPLVQHLLPWQPVKYHTGSDMQKKLLFHAGLKPVSVTELVCNMLLPHLEPSADSQTEPVILKALDALADLHLPTVSLPSHLYVEEATRPVSSLVDSTCEELQVLFTDRGVASTTDSSSTALAPLPQHEGNTYTLLPKQYTVNQRLPLLKRLGICHTNSPNPRFFQACLHKFTECAARLEPAQIASCSVFLVQMLRKNIDAYAAADNWGVVAPQLALCRFLLAASSSLTLEDSTSQLVSFFVSQDHTSYHLVSFVRAVTSKMLGDTRELRVKLGLAPAPDVNDVVRHLLLSAAAWIRLETKGKVQALLEATKPAYAYIFAHVSEQLQLPMAGSAVTDMLKQKRWILTQDRSLAMPNSLIFGKDADIEPGESCTCLHRFCLSKYTLHVLCWGVSWHQPN